MPKYRIPIQINADVIIVADDEGAASLRVNDLAYEEVRLVWDEPRSLEDVTFDGHGIVDNFHNDADPEEIED